MSSDGMNGETVTDPFAGSTSPALLAFYLQMGRLWNQYRWYLDWYLCLGISARFSEFFRNQLDEVLVMFGNIRTSTDVRVPARFIGTTRKTISLHEWHTMLFSHIRNIHSALVEDLDQLRVYSQLSEPHFYETLIRRMWEDFGSESIESWDPTIFDAWEAADRINVQRKYVYELHIDRLEKLWQMHLRRNEKIRRSFDLGKLVDELIHPSFTPCDWRTQVFQVWERLYHLRDHLHFRHTQEQLDLDSEEDTCEDVLRDFCSQIPVPVLPDLPPGNEQISIHVFNDFFTKFYNRNRIWGSYVAIADEESGRDETDIVWRGKQRSRFSEVKSTLERLKRTYHARILNLIYHESFYPDIEDLRQLQNLISKLHLSVEVPDLHQLHTDLLVPHVVNIAPVELDLQAVFDLLIKQQTLLSNEHLVQRLVNEAMAISIPLAESCFHAYQEALDDKSRVQAVDQIFSRMASTLINAESDLKRNQQIDWLKNQYKDGHPIVAIYIYYLQCCQIEKDDFLCARIAAERYVENSNDKVPKKSVNTVRRYMDIAKKQIKDQFGQICVGHYD